MSEMVARVAAAVEEACRLAPKETLGWADVARVAIAALREPTEAMLEAVIERPTPLIEERTAQGCTEYAARMDAAVAAERLVLRQRWQAMIDAAGKKE